VKLVRSSCIKLNSPVRDLKLRTTVRSFDLQLLPSNNSQYFVSTSAGSILHGLRYGGIAKPKVYRNDLDTMVDVTSLDFSPFNEPVFLAGCSDGSLRFYHVDIELPVISWLDATEGGCPIVLVRWCRSRPSIFFVLDENSCLYIWDVHMDSTSALKRERIAKSRVSSLCLSNDHSATGQGIPGRAPQMVVFLDNGTTEAHIIKREFSALMPEELGHFKKFIQKSA